VVPVLVRLGGQTVELGQAVLGDDAQQAWLELEPADVRRVLQRLEPVPPPARASEPADVPESPAERHESNRRALRGGEVDAARPAPTDASLSTGRTEPVERPAAVRVVRRADEGAGSARREPAFGSTPPPPPSVLASRARDTTERCVADLEWLAERSQRILADPKKERWHGALRAQLASILEELNRLQRRSH
jgi:hypothetical protein